MAGDWHGGRGRDGDERRREDDRRPDDDRRGGDRRGRDSERGWDGGRGKGDSEEDLEACRVWVGGCPNHITERELTKEFSKFGSVQEVTIKNSTRDTFAFVLYTKESYAIEAIEKLDQARIFGGSVVKVASATRKGGDGDRGNKGGGKGDKGNTNDRGGREPVREASSIKLGCRFLARREPCKFGASCKFSHDERDIESQRKNDQLQGIGPPPREDRRDDRRDDRRADCRDGRRRDDRADYRDDRGTRDDYRREDRRDPRDDRGAAPTDDQDARDDCRRDVQRDPRDDRGRNDRGGRGPPRDDGRGPPRDDGRGPPRDEGRGHPWDEGRGPPRDDGRRREGVRSRSPLPRSDARVPAKNDAKRSFKICVENLPQDMEEDELVEICAEFGRVLSYDLWRHGRAKKGVVEFRNESEAARAIQELDDRPIQEWHLRLRAFASRD